MSDSATKVVLVVEDDPLLRQLLQRGFVRGGYQCETAEDGQAGHDRLVSGSYSLLVSDMRMPKMSGLSMLETARRHLESLPPTIVLSGFHDHPEETLIKLGVSRVLYKPIRLQHLLSVAAELLKQ